jgi:hypothetical protein
MTIEESMAGTSNPFPEPTWGEARQDFLRKLFASDPEDFLRRLFASENEWGLKGNYAKNDRRPAINAEMGAIPAARRITQST